MGLWFNIAKNMPITSKMGGLLWRFGRKDEKGPVSITIPGLSSVVSHLFTCVKRVTGACWRRSCRNYFAAGVVVEAFLV
jgi:hypothetical protein